MNLDIQVYDSIENVPLADWDHLAPRNHVGLESAHLRVLERARINDLCPYYIIGSIDGRPMAIAHFIFFRMDFSSIGTEIPPTVRQTVKSWFPEFLDFKIIECGLISALWEPMACASDELLSSFSGEVAKILEAKGQELGADVIFIRDIPYARYQHYRHLERQQYASTLGFPICLMELKWSSFNEYFNALKHKTRNNIHLRLAKLKAPEITIETITDFAPHAERLAELWQQIYDRSVEYKHDYLTPEYFRQVNKCLGDKSNVILIRRQGEIIGFALNFIGEEEYFAGYCGLEYEYNQQYDLYFNIYFLSLQDAFRLGKRRFNVGVTTEGFKTFIGCELNPVVYFIKHLRQPELSEGLASLMARSIKQAENYHRPFIGQDISSRRQLREVAVELANSKLQSNDVFNRAWSYTKFDRLRVTGLYSFCQVFEGAQQPIMQYEERPVIMLGSSSYVGLGSHPEVREAAKAAIDKYGTSCAGSPILNGTTDLHVELAQALAKFLGKDDALLCSTGYGANLGVIYALAQLGDVVILDELNHASLIDGAKICNATIALYRHNDMASLEATLQRYVDKPKFVIADSVFSMDGNMVDLPPLVELIKKYHARLFLDEAHACGLIGPGGRGVAEHFGLLDQVDLIMGALSKIFVSVGGFVAGDAKLIDYLRFEARPHVFSGSLPAQDIAAAKKALEIIIREPERRARTLANAKYMTEGLRALGYQASFNNTAIVPVHCGDEVLTLALQRKLLDEGVYVNPVLAPAVPKGKERIRTTYMPDHTTEMLDRALSVFAKLRTPNYPIRS